MLGKLFKHDFKALARMLIPTQLAIFAATILGTLSLTFILRSSNTPNVTGGTMMSIIQVILGLLIGIMVLAIIAASFLTLFIIFQRFYKNFMCSEGYLTFTLPVTTAQLLWSKFLAAMVWYFISTIVIILCVLFFITFGTASHGLISNEPLKLIAEAFRFMGQYTSGYTILLGVETFVVVVMAAAQQILHVYLAIILGGVVAKQHKVFAAIGFYFAINMGLSVLLSVGQIVLLNGSLFMQGQAITGAIGEMETINRIVIEVQPMLIYCLIVSVITTVACFIFSHYLLKNKLNLE